MEILSALSNYQSLALVGGALGVYMLLIRLCRFQRCKAIRGRFAGRPLSSMTVKDAHQIIRELRELEFPYSLHNAMKLSLLKVCRKSPISTTILTIPLDCCHSDNG